MLYKNHVFAALKANVNASLGDNDPDPVTTAALGAVMDSARTVYSSPEGSFAPPPPPLHAFIISQLITEIQKSRLARLKNCRQMRVSSRQKQRPDPEAYAGPACHGMATIPSASPLPVMAASSSSGYTNTS
jgi:hypothetical protein